MLQGGIVLCHVPQASESAKLLHMSLNVIDVMIHNTMIHGLPISFKILNHTFTDAKGKLINDIFVNRHLERISMQKNR